MGYHQSSWAENYYHTNNLGFRLISFIGLGFILASIWAVIYFKLHGKRAKILGEPKIKKDESQRKKTSSS